MKNLITLFLFAIIVISADAQVLNNKIDPTNQIDSIRFNNIAEFPNNAGNVSDLVLSTNGTGQMVFVPATVDTDLFTENKTATIDITHDLDGNIFRMENGFFDAENATGFRVFNAEQSITIAGNTFMLPSAKAQYIDPSDGVIFTTGVEDVSVVNGNPAGTDRQAWIGRFNPANFNQIGVTVRDGSMNFQASQAGARTGGLELAQTGELFIFTPGQVAGTATNGQILSLLDTNTGEVEFLDAPGVDKSIDTFLELAGGETTVTLNAAPASESDILVYLNGQLLTWQGSTPDWTLLGTTLTLTSYVGVAGHFIEVLAR